MSLLSVVVKLTMSKYFLTVPMVPAAWATIQLARDYLPAIWARM
jgi:hypothetical protein